MKLSFIYHSFLMATWLSAVSLMMAVFLSGGYPGTLSSYFLAQMGSDVNVTASVPPNPYNTMAQQLKEKEDELKLREQALLQRENQPAGPASDSASGIDPAMAVLSTLGFLLSLYMPIHFYYDLRRKRAEFNVSSQGV